jgi:CO/xanthine dehydrogenase Mo-binding subunit
LCDLSGGCRRDEPRGLQCLPMHVGRSTPRKEGRGKVTGEARYVDDLALPGMLHGVTVRSASPRGLIRDIRYAPGISWDEIVVVTAADIPGANVVALINDDQPYLADGRVNHAEEPVVLLAHRDRSLLEEARRRVTIEIEPLPPVYTIDESLAAREIIWGTDNIFKKYLVSRGDVDAAFAEAGTIVEAEYATGAQEQLYIEPNGMLAVARREDGVTVWGSMQCPYYIHRALERLFSLPTEKDMPRCWPGNRDVPSRSSTTARKTWWRRRSAIRRGRATGPR